MDRVTAQRLVDKLEAVTVDRGATGPEAKAAAFKAKSLRDRFDLHARPRATPPRARPRPAPAAGYARWTGGSMFATAPPEFEFDVSTGKASANVRVHRYRSRHDWKIEIYPSEDGSDAKVTQER